MQLINVSSFEQNSYIVLFCFQNDKILIELAYSSAVTGSPEAGVCLHGTCNARIRNPNEFYPPWRLSHCLRK